MFNIENLLPLLVKFKKLHPEAVTPKYSREGDAALDLTAISVERNGNDYIYDTGLAIEIPSGYFGLLMPRSSNIKKDLILGNSLGLIDSNYRGPLKFIYKEISETVPARVYSVGDRVGQLLILPYPRILLQEVDELSESNRGDKGFGSSGA